MNARITHIDCLGIHFPITHTSVTKTKCFGIICVFAAGLIAEEVHLCCRQTPKPSLEVGGFMRIAQSVLSSGSRVEILASGRQIHKRCDRGNQLEATEPRKHFIRRQPP